MGRRTKLDTRKRNQRIVLLSIAMVAIIAIVTVIYIAHQSSNTNYPIDHYINAPVNSTTLRALTGVTGPTLTAVGGGAPSSVSAPAKVSGPPLTVDGKPEVLYVGGEFCPFCAIERWSMIIAFSKFGTFSGLQYMLSSATDVNANTPTFTFANATYASQYIAFVPVEEFGRAGPSDVRQPLTSEQQGLVSQYDTCAVSGQSGGIPFIDFANQYAVNCGAQSGLVIAGQGWSSIASQLNDPSSTVAKNIDGAANYLITAICKIDGGQPSTVCGQPYADLPLAYLASSSPGAATTDMVMTVAGRGDETVWTG
jgi:Domain of unknown function (DUF929)